MYLNDPALIEWFKQAWPGPLVRASGWLFPFGETMHFIGLCMLFGAMIFIDLRLMGYFMDLHVKAVLSLIPFAVLGFLINLGSGWLMFTSAPASYLENPAFLLKMGLIALAGLNAVAFALWEQRSVSLLGPGEATPRSAQIFAGLSLLMWLAILLLGRWLPLFTIGTN